MRPSIWHYINPLTLTFKDGAMDRNYMHDFHTNRAAMDVTWSFFGLLSMLAVVTRSTVPAAKGSFAHCLIRLAPGLACLLVPRRNYAGLRPAIMVGMRVARSVLWLHTVFYLANHDVLHGLALESLLSSLLIPFGQMTLFKDHLVWNTGMVLCVIIGVCGKGGICAQMEACTSGADPLGCKALGLYSTTFRALSMTARVLVKLLFPGLYPEELTNKPLRCVPAALSLLVLLGIVTPTVFLYCFELRSRRLALHSRGLVGSPGDLHLAFYLVQNIGLVVAAMATLSVTFLRWM